MDTDFLKDIKPSIKIPLKLKLFLPVSLIIIFVVTTSAIIFINLTISGYNSALGNKSFEEKRERKDKQGRHVGYKNGLKLNEDLVNCSEWTIQQIDIRTKKLVDQAMDLFKLM